MFKEGLDWFLGLRLNKYFKVLIFSPGDALGTHVRELLKGGGWLGFGNSVAVHTTVTHESLWL